MYVAFLWMCLHVTTSKHYTEHFIIILSCINDTGLHKQLLWVRLHGCVSMSSMFLSSKRRRGISLTLSCSAAVKELGNDMSHSVLCLPSVSALCLKARALWLPSKRWRESTGNMESSREKMKHGGQGKSESGDKVQEDKISVTVIVIGLRHLQTSYCQGFLCIS